MIKQRDWTPDAGSYIPTCGKTATPEPHQYREYGKTCQCLDKRKGFETCGEPKKPGWGMCEYHLDTTAPIGNQFKTSRGY